MERGRVQAADLADGDSAATSDARPDELVAGQYADRPQLRPVLDAVLAALPALGPVTVQPAGRASAWSRPAVSSP